MKNETFKIFDRIPLEKKREILEIPPMVDQLVRREVESFHGLSPYYIQDNFKSGPSEIICRFQGNKMANLTNLEGFQKSKLINVRCTAIAHFMAELYNKYSAIMEDMDVIVPFSFSDMSTAPRQRIPSLTFCKSPNSNNILIPSVNNLVGYAELEHVAMYDYPLLEKRDEMCFVGSFTNVEWNGKGMEHNQRLQIAALAAEHPQLYSKLIAPKDFGESFKEVHAKAIELFPALADPEIFTTQYDNVEIKDQLHRKYQICVDGHVCAWARLPWQLGSNSVPIKIRNPDFAFKEWYYPLLDFNKHCLEINLEDLDEVFEYLVHSPDEQLAIAGRGKTFVEEYITPDLGQRILLWTILLLSEQQQLFLPELPDQTPVPSE